MLPSEICVYILKIRNNIRNNASKKIQNAWRKYIVNDCVAIDYALEIEIDQFNQIMVYIPSTAIILKYCLSMCSGKFYLNFWKTLAENLKNVPSLKDNQDLIRPLTNPIKPTGHICILKGNLAPKGSVAKITGKEGLFFKGPAKVFDGEFDANDGISSGKVKKGDVVAFLKVNIPKTDSQFIELVATKDIDEAGYISSFFSYIYSSILSLFN